MDSLLTFIKRFFLLLFLVFNFSLLNAQTETVISGIYLDRNMVITNPFAASGSGFCITKITINEIEVTEEFLSSAFELNFKKYGFKKNDPISVIITHKEGCKPQIMNPGALIPKSTYKCLTITADRTQTLKWVTSGEDGALLFVVEQFKWNKWVKVGSIMGQGSSKTNYYSLEIPVHSGVNKYRVKQVDYSKKPRYSKAATYRNSDKPITFLPGNKQRAGDKITFSAITSYQIYDFYGKVIKSGTSDAVTIKKLSAGTYFINYDNTTAEFIKK